MCEQTLPRQAQVILTAKCAMLESTVLTLGLLRFQLHFTCSATLFLSFEVRLCCRFHRQGKWFPSLWSLKSKSSVISTWLSKESALPGVFVDFSVARGLLPPPRYGCRRLLASPRGIKLSLRTCRSNSVSFHFTQTFPEKVLVVSNHALLKSLYVRNKVFLTSDCMLARKGPGATRRSLQIAAQVDSFRSTPNCNHNQLARLTGRRSLPSELETKAVPNFCFPNLVAKNVHLVAMMRLVFGC